MKRVLLILAVLGAVLSGWVPAVAATLAAGQPASMHAMHRTGDEDAGDTHGKAKPAAHPVACSACFAIEAQRLDAVNHAAGVSARVSAAMPRLAGIVPSLLDPPPRS